jgi:hypothetical protein
MSTMHDNGDDTVNAEAFTTEKRVCEKLKALFDDQHVCKPDFFQPKVRLAMENYDNETPAIHEI